MGNGSGSRIRGPLALVAGVLFMVAGAISGNYALWVPIGSIWLVLGAVALRRRRSGRPPPPPG